MSDVEYKTIDRFPGYRFGSDGSVWSSVRYPSWKIMYPFVAKTGHLRVGLTMRGKQTSYFVHRLILEAFVGPRPDKEEGCHFPDRNPANNAISNLRWGTKKSNMADQLIHGTRCRGERNGNATLTEVEIIDIRNKYADGYLQIEIAEEYGIYQSRVSAIVMRKIWRHVI